MTRREGVDAKGMNKGVALVLKNIGKTVHSRHRSINFKMGSKTFMKLE